MKTPGDIAASFRFPTELLAVQYHYGQKEDHLGLVHLRRKGQQVEVMGEKSAQNPEALLEGLKKLPCVLLLTGKKVLSKQVSLSAAMAGEAELLDRALPNANPEELLVEINEINNEAVVSATRLTVLQELLESWPEGCPVVEVVLGVHSLWPLLEKLEGPEFEGGWHHFNLDTGEAKPQEGPARGNVSIFGESLPSVVALAFMAGLKKLGEPHFETRFALVAKNQEDWKYGRLYRTGLAVSGSLLLGVLLASFLFFNHYNRGISELSITTSAFGQQMAEVKRLKEDYAAKEQFLQVNGSQASGTSAMADKIALLLPSGITLTEMAFHPLEKRLKKENLVRFSRNEILLKGETRAYGPFQQMMAALKQQPWAGKISIAGYEEKGSSHEASFVLTIKLKENHGR